MPGASVAAARAERRRACGASRVRRALRLEDLAEVRGARVDDLRPEAGRVLAPALGPAVEHVEDLADLRAADVPLEVHRDAVVEVAAGDVERLRGEALGDPRAGDRPGLPVAPGVRVPVRPVAGDVDPRDHVDRLA